MNFDGSDHKTAATRDGHNQYASCVGVVTRPPPPTMTSTAAGAARSKQSSGTKLQCRALRTTQLATMSGCSECQRRSASSWMPPPPLKSTRVSSLRWHRPATGWCLLLLGVLFAACSHRHPGALAEFTRLSSRTVTTKYGALKGYIETPSGRHLQPVEVFLGVPYATPPTGAMRFMPPGTPVHWRGVRMADRPAPVCPQRFPDIRNESDALKRMPLGRLDYLRRLLPHLQRQSEDCLYLNIYTPAIGELGISFAALDFYEYFWFPVLVFRVPLGNSGLEHSRCTRVF